MLTRVVSGLYGGRLAGSFAGKTASGSPSHPVGVLTRVESGIYGGRRTGSFTGKTSDGGAGSHPVDRLTRVTSGLWGARLAGSFAGRVESATPPITPPPAVSFGGGGYHIPRYDTNAERRKKEMLAIMQIDDETILNVIITAVTSELLN